MEISSFVKGDSLIVLAINTNTKDYDMVMKMDKTPFSVSGGDMVLSWGNESDQLCQKETLTLGETLKIDQATKKVTVELPAQCVATYVFQLDKGATAIQEHKLSDVDGAKTYYDLHGRRLETPKGLCIERSADGTSRKINMNR